MSLEFAKITKNTEEYVDYMQNYLDMKKSCTNMFNGAKTLTTINDLLRPSHTSNVTNMQYMFYNCSNLTTIPLLDTSKVHTMTCMFYSCPKLTSIPPLDTSKVNSMNQMFYQCYKLKTIESLDMSNVTDVGQMFLWCYELTNLTLRNIKKGLQIGSGTSWGHLLTLDSLVNTCKECINIGSANTLTIGSANIEKLASVYVRLTNEPEEDETNPKLPCEVCEATDEGAMLITEYMALKNWTIQ